MSSNPFEEGFRKDAAYLGALGGLAHLSNQSRQQAKLSEQTEELKKQNSLIEEQNRALSQQQRTNENLEQIAQARLQIEQNRAELERPDKEEQKLISKTRGILQTSWPCLKSLLLSSIKFTNNIIFKNIEREIEQWP